MKDRTENHHQPAEEPTVTPLTTAAHSWQEFFVRTPYGRYVSLEEADRADDLPGMGDQELQRLLEGDSTVGGLLVWEDTSDRRESGYLVMITGQTIEDEHQVMDNAKWLISCGAVYHPERVGWRSKRTADWSRTVNGFDQRVWLLWNDRDVRGMLR